MQLETVGASCAVAPVLGAGKAASSMDGTPRKQNQSYRRPPRQEARHEASLQGDFFTGISQPVRQLFQASQLRGPLRSRMIVSNLLILISLSLLMCVYIYIYIYIYICMYIYIYIYIYMTTLE